MLNIFRKKLGEIIKIVLGRNSATKRIKAVEINVFTISRRRSDPMNGSRAGLIISAKTRPYITRATLLPISIVAIYWPGLSVNILSIPEPNTWCFLSSSILRRLDVTKAISIPEKNAERTTARSIIT